MSVSIGSSRGAPPSEVHDECLHRKFTRSASIEGLSLKGFDRTPHKSVSFGSTTKTFQAEKTQVLGVHSECLHQRGSNQSVSIKGVPTEGLYQKGSNQGSPSERFQPMVSYGGVPTEGLRPRVSIIGVPTGVSPSEGFQPRVFIIGIPFSEKEEIGGSYRESDGFYHFDQRPLIKELGEEADALPTIAPAKAPHSCNHIISPRTQDTSTEVVPSDRGSEGVSEGKDATTNKLNEDADPNGMFLDDGFNDDDSPN
ncbi:hypothetical protein Tco_1465325 [Tanacetum coccineum]